MRAWNHHSRVIGERNARAAVEAVRSGTAAGEAPDGKSHKLMLTALAADCRQLSDLPQGSMRIERKKALLAQWLPVVEKYLRSGGKYRNVILTQVMVWAFDIADIDTAMRLARVAVAQEQPMPERFRRDVRTGVADLLLGWIATRNGQPVDPYFSEIFGEIFPNDRPGWQIHDEIKIKYLKVAISRNLATHPETALKLCLLAEKISPSKAKVKTVKEKLLKQLRK